MREDPTKSATFLNSKIWERQKYNEDFLVPPDQFDFESDDPRNERKFISNSLSGNERNRMFMQQDNNFADISLLSGTDDLADARSFSLVDYDNDGWVDIALMSLNTPRFKLYKNELGKLYPKNSVLRVRLIGGHDSTTPTEQFSNRDGIGARILVTYGSGKIAVFQKQAGEGFASQNSSTLRIGCPEGDRISKLDVRWPSGLTTSLAAPDTSTVISIREIKK